MSTALTILLSIALQFVTPELVGKLIQELVDLLDPILTKRGMMTRWTWGYAKKYLESPAFLAELKDVMNEIEAKLAIAKAEQKIAL